MVQQLSEDIANGEPGVLILAISPYTSAKEALTLLRRTGVNPVVLGGTSLSNDFPQLFRGEPEENREPGFFTNNTYIATPIIYDSSSERAQEFGDRFYKTFGIHANEISASYYDAAFLVVEALRNGGVHLTSQSRG